MENIKITPLIKIGATVILLLCLAKMPYGFYELARFALAAAFAFLSYDAFKNDNNGIGFIYVCLALLFQPFYKIALGRALWNAVDIAVAVALIYVIIKAFNKKKDNP